MTQNTNNQQLETSLEALLFYKGEPQRIRDLASTLDVSPEEINTALNLLASSLIMRGIRLVHEGEYAGLATAPEVHSLIEKVRKDELEGPLGKAGLETLAVILYHGPLSKADIEYVRGVNCSSILRSLTMRGLVEKIEHPTDRRSVLYRGTPELPALLGLETLADAPDYESIKAEVTRILETQEQETAEENN